MKSRKFILRETISLILGELVCSAAMVGVYALLEKLSYKVFLGAAIGILLAVGNFFFMAIASDAAADKASNQDVKAGRSLMKLSYRMRLILIGVLLFLFAKSGHCDLLSLVLPLFFVFPILMVIEFFRKSGDAKA